MERVRVLPLLVIKQGNNWLEMVPLLLSFFLVLIIEFNHVLDSFMALYRPMAYIGGSETSKDMLPGVMPSRYFDGCREG